MNSTLSALADPTRRAILNRLSAGEARITDLAEPFEMSLNAVSRHIRVLEHAHLIQRRRVWREHWVRLQPSRLNEIADWMAHQRTLWTQRLTQLDALLQEEDRQAAEKKTHKVIK